jgi:hypothetical protein
VSTEAGEVQSDRAWQAQIRLHHRHHDMIARSKRSTVVNVTIARELAAFIWAELTDQPTRQQATA